MINKELSKNVYLKVKGIIEGAYITPLAREVKVHKRREGEVAGPLEGRLTCSLSIQLRGKAEKELMRTFAKKAGFTVKDNIPKLLIPQKKDVGKYFREMERLTSLSSV